MKTILGLGQLLVVLVLVIAGGCSDDSPVAGTSPDSAPITVAFLRHDNPNYVKADREFFDAYLATHPNVKIADTTYPFNTVASMLIADLKRDQLPFDLVLMPPSYICSFAKNLTEVPADIVTLSQAENTFFRAPLEGSVCNQKLFGLPVEYNLEYGGVVVNTDKYKAKFPDKVPGAWPTWDAFIADAAALTEYDLAGKPMANGLDIDPDWPAPVIYSFLSQILQRGGTYFGPGGTFDFSTPAARDAMTDMVGWLTVHKVMHPQLIPASNTGVTTRLAAGATGFGWSDPKKPLSVMGYVGTWGLPATLSQRVDGASWNYDFFLLPPMVGTEHAFVTDSGWSFAVPRTSKNPKVAWDIARSLALSPEAMRKWSLITGVMPALRANGSVTAAATDPVLARVQPLLEHGRWRGFVPVAAKSTWRAFNSNFFAAASGSKSVDQALMDLQRTCNTAVAEAGD